MKILKKLFGKTNVKIHAGEIWVAPGLLLPDAVIEESGSNSDGDYMKFGNGWMVCWGRDITFENNTDLTSLTQKTFNLPEKFSSNNFIVLPVTTAPSGSWSFAVEILSAQPTTRERYDVIWRNASGARVQTYRFSMFAIGRWK